MATFPNVNDMNVEFPNRYRMKAPDDTGEGEVVDLVPEQGFVVDPGTPLDSVLFDGVKAYVDDTSDGVKSYVDDRFDTIEGNLVGRNLVLDPNPEITTDEYKVLGGYLSEPWVVGATYTVTIKGSVNEPNQFTLWRHSGGSLVAHLSESDVESGVYAATFVCPAPNEGQDLDVFSVYNYPYDTATSSSIEWIKIEHALDADTLGGLSQEAFWHDGNVTYHGDGGNGAIRYPDGFQIAWLVITTDIAIDIPYADGAAFQGIYTWEFSAEFSSNPSVSCGRFQHSNTASWGTVVYQDTHNQKTRARLRGMDFLSRDSGPTRISAIAVGRWK